MFNKLSFVKLIKMENSCRMQWKRDRISDSRESRYLYRNQQKLARKKLYAATLLSVAWVALLRSDFVQNVHYFFSFSITFHNLVFALSGGLNTLKYEREVLILRPLIANFTNFANSRTKHYGLWKWKWHSYSFKQIRHRSFES